MVVRWAGERGLRRPGAALCRPPRLKLPEGPVLYPDGELTDEPEERWPPS